MIVDEDASKFAHKRKTYGYILTYVDDFTIVGPIDLQKANEEEISRCWKIKTTRSVDQFDSQDPDAPLNFLSTTVRSHPKKVGS